MEKEMKQPKFKFGECVKYIGKSATKWSVRLVYWCDKVGEYVYENHQGTMTPESCLELYQEPQKKKLYAYHEGFNPRGQIHFFPYEKLEGNFLVRAPEYDIEYPIIVTEK